MPSNNSTYIDNQAIQLYKVDPSDNNIAQGMTSWVSTAYHKRNGNCGFIGLDYCQPVLQTDFMNFQFKADYGAELFQTLFSTPISTGTATSTTANHLVDATADFITEGVQAGRIVKNTTDNTGAKVTTVNSLTDLTLSSDIFVSGEAYQIYNIDITGNFTYNPVGNLFTVASAGSSSIETALGLTVGGWYKVTVNITDLTAGSIQVILGNNTIATLNSVGTHIVYGQCLVNGNFQILASSTFLGTVSGASININKLEQDYVISIFDLDGVYQSSIGITYDGDALNIGNVLVNIEWGNFALECGCYVIGVYSGITAPCSGTMITNGNFSSDLGWTLSGGMEISGGKLNINTGGGGDTAINDLSCNIVSGNSYTLTYVVSEFESVKTGSYVVKVNGTAVSPSYNAATQTNVSLTFTAPGNDTTITFELLSASTFSIDNVVLTCNDCVLNQGNADALSEAYCVCDTHDCTILLKYRNTRNAFGNYYGDDTYYNYLRLPASIQSANITDKELIQFKNTLHQMNIPYWNGIKVEEIATDLLPNWVHNAIAVAIKHRVLYIDGVQYIGIAEHSPIIDKTEVFGAVTKIARVNQSNLNSNW